MVKKKEGFSDATYISKNLIESIVNEVFKIIIERADSCYDLFEGMKLQTYGTDNIVDCVIVKGENLEKTREFDNQGTFNLNPHLSDICHPSIPEVFSSSISKQGEGDFQSPPIRETTAFYCLETDKCSRQYGGASDSSLNVEISSNNLIEHLHKKIHNLSFDDIQLSDSEADDGLHSSIRHSVANKFLKPPHSQNGSFINDQNTIQHSQKFCQYNNTQYFPYNNITIPNYCTLVNEDYDDEEQTKNDDGDEDRQLLSGSSQELITVEGESDQVLPGVMFSSTNPFHTSSTIALSSHCFPDTISLDSKRSVSEINTIQVNADVEPCNWEEALEVQMNVTEPVKSSEAQNTDGETIIQTRKYWSSIGLINESKVNSKYLGPLQMPGIESVPGITPVEIKRLKQQPEEEIWVTELQSQDEDEEALFNKAFIADDTVNYLSYSTKEGKEKKKKKFIARLASTISNMLRLKKRNTKH